VKLIDLHCGDSLVWMKSMPPNFVDLWVTSPPYEDARTYSGTFKPKRGDDWVAWYIPYVVEMCRTSKTFAAVNVGGLVDGFRYSGIDQALATDLRRHHGIVQGPAPYAWVKSSGIPGSGSVCYQRRNWEPVYLFAEEHKLGPKKRPHYSNNTAFGAPCKHRPGGEMSYSMRVRTGGRANESKPGTRTKTMRGRHGDGGEERKRKVYVPPDIANPGNVFDFDDEGDVIRTKNGGGHTGHRRTKNNEAPMNLKVAERLVRWFAPRGGRVGDPMCGSGTTLHAALMHGCRAIGCDTRPDQILETKKRLATVRCAY
jgi:DNA methylase